jgi:hypothetical protein
MKKDGEVFDHDFWLKYFAGQILSATMAQVKPNENGVVEWETLDKLINQAMMSGALLEAKFELSKKGGKSDET